ncbi:MAG: hypothetical protein DA405_01200 [Bacteroidetes bacterium]|nr:MAG: hypothetical protein DA405_01200 [Bacteroidota bacterium]
MKKILFLAFTFISSFSFAQEAEKDYGQIHGNFQTNAQYYLRDTIIDPNGTAFPDERLLAAGFLNLTYSKGDFMAGLRYENYQNNLIGLPEGFKGEGIPYRFIRYKHEGLDLTVGNYYEQFGSGLIFRTYEERGLGLDNAMDGLRLIYEIRPGLKAKALVGRQRIYFETSDGIVRGGDLEFNLNEFNGTNSRTNLIVGAGAVSRFEESTDPIYNLPENVAAASLRANFISGNFNIFGEYAYKSQDPNSSNRFIFKPGHAIYANGSYSKGNLGIILGYKYYDNFLFRSERVANFTELLINYQPPLAELHTYALPALYSYNVQANGETGMQAEIAYKFDKGTLVGGRYGTLVNLNFSNSYALDKSFITRPGFDSVPTISGTDGYSVEGAGLDIETRRLSWFNDNLKFDIPRRLNNIQYSQDFNVEVKTKINKSLKGTFSYYNFIYNRSALLDGVVDDLVSDPNTLEIVYVNAMVAEILWKIKPKHSLRSEAQLMLTDQDRGSWALLLLEYSIAPQWFFAVQDAYNYGHPDPDLRVHYPLVSMGYTRGTTKFQFNYGRQQEGVFCVGGICRVVPASNGFSMMITTNF